MKCGGCQPMQPHLHDDQAAADQGRFAVAIARIVRYAFSSLLGFVADNVLFSVCVLALQSQGVLRHNVILVSICVARVFSATLNFYVNRCFVFHSKSSLLTSFAKYWLLAFVIALLSFVLTASISALGDVKGLYITAVKITMESIIFVISYLCQMRWVFGGGKSAMEK